MAGFKDWTDLDQGEHLDLPIRGKTYRIPSPPARIGLRVQALVNAGVQAARAAEQGEEVELDQQLLDDLAEVDVARDLLGPVHQQLLDDGVTTEALKRVMVTVMMWVAFDLDTARAVWEGKAPTPPNGKSAAGSTTRSQTRGSGTNRSGRPGRNQRARASHGGKSSNTGRR